MLGMAADATDRIDAGLHRVWRLGPVSGEPTTFTARLLGRPLVNPELRRLRATCRQALIDERSNNYAMR